MNRLYKQAGEKKNICLYLPESFEWLILNSGLIEEKNVRNILEQPEKFIDSREFLSWERFFTEILICFSDEKYKYSKKHLNPYYVLPYNLEKVKKYLWEGLQIIL